jgi:hypothetical protein
VKILSCFAPNLTAVCERFILTYSHHFDVFLCGAATINFTFSFHAYVDYNHLQHPVYVDRIKEVKETLKS